MKFTGPPCGRNPTSTPTVSITVSPSTLCNRSAIVRPASTAERAIGSDRKRSINPRCKSSAIPTPVVMQAKISVCTKIPGIR